MKTLMILLILVSCIDTEAQQLSPQVIASTGGIVSQINAQLSYTVGEPVIGTGDDGTTVLSQGYQQPHFEITQLSELGSECPEVSVFPNPTTDGLNISFHNNEEISVQVILFDALGNLLQRIETNVLSDEIITCDLMNYAAGIYVLQIQLGSGSSMKTFEIIKQ
jgi:hypothetical protein